MSNVIDLHRRERLIWMCGNCGCSTFYLYSDQTIECAGCEHVSDGGEWVTPIENKAKAPEKDNASSICVIAIGSPQVARLRVLKKINDRAADIALTAAWFDDGAMTSWCGAETEEQKAWAIRKLSELSNSIEQKPVNAE